MKRRNFSKSASAFMAGSIFMGPTIMDAYAKGKRVSPNDKLQIGVIGCNGLGKYKVHFKNEGCGFGCYL